MAGRSLVRAFGQRAHGPAIALTRLRAPIPAAVLVATRALSQLASASHPPRTLPACAGFRQCTTVASAKTAAPSSLPPVVLYKYHICPFCWKVQALLSFFSIPFRSVEVNPLTKANHPKPPTKENPAKPYTRVPIARIGDDMVVDSAQIVDALRAVLLAHPELVGKDEVQGFFSDEAMKWARWTDERLAVLVYPNLSGSLPNSLQAFSYVWNEPSFSLLARASVQLVGGLAMWMVQGKVKAKHKIVDERAELRAALAEVHTALTAHDQGFLLGAAPTMADVSVFSVLRAVEGTHLHAGLLDHPALRAWYDRMRLKTHQA